MRIPINNLYFLLVYAWDVLEESKLVDVAATELSVPADLFARLLKEGVEHLLKRGLDRAYQAETATIPGVRGRLDIAASIKALAFPHGHAVCEFDNLTHDVVHNQIVKATMRRLAICSDVDTDLRRDLRDQLAAFSAVRDLDLSNEMFRRVQLHSNNRFYRLLINICWILHHQLLPTPDGDRFQFVEFSDDELERVFESFVRNYLRKTQSTFVVKVERFSWQQAIGDADALSYLPHMQTDASLTSPQRKLVIEAKFYQKTLAERNKGDSERIRSAHLYQLVSYLRNLSKRDDRIVEGLLLYPRVDVDLRHDYSILGHKIRVATIDLTADSDAIGESLRDLALTRIEPGTYGSGEACLTPP